MRDGSSGIGRATRPSGTRQKALTIARPMPRLGEPGEQLPAGGLDADVPPDARGAEGLGDQRAVRAAFGGDDEALAREVAQADRALLGEGVGRGDEDDLPDLGDRIGAQALGGRVERGDAEVGLAGAHRVDGALVITDEEAELRGRRGRLRPLSDARAERFGWASARSAPRSGRVGASMLGGEAAEALAEEVEVRALAGAEDDGALDVAVGQIGDEGAHALAGVAAEAEHALAVGGEGEALAAAGVEGDAEGLGELLDLRVERGLRDAASAGGAGEVQVLGERDEGVEVLGVDGGAHGEGGDSLLRAIRGRDSVS